MAQANYVTTAIPSQFTNGRTTNGVKAAHSYFVAALAGRPPLAIKLIPNPVDVEDRAEHLGHVLTAVSLYLSVILEDTAENVPGGIDLHYIEAALSDLMSDVVGTVRNAANDLAGRLA
jgi:hypothetical protein